MSAYSLGFFLFVLVCLLSSLLACTAALSHSFASLVAAFWAFSSFFHCTSSSRIFSAPVQVSFFCFSCSAIRFRSSLSSKALMHSLLVKTLAWPVLSCLSRLTLGMLTSSAKGERFAADSTVAELELVPTVSLFGSVWGVQLKYDLQFQCSHFPRGLQIYLYWHYNRSCEKVCCLLIASYVCSDWMMDTEPLGVSGIIQVISIFESTRIKLLFSSWKCNIFSTTINIAAVMRIALII